MKSAEGGADFADTEDFGDYEIDAIIGKEVNITIEEADNGFYNITHIEKI